MATVLLDITPIYGGGMTVHASSPVWPPECKDSVVSIGLAEAMICCNSGMGCERKETVRGNVNKQSRRNGGVVGADGLRKI